MIEIEARALADEIARDPEFQIDEVHQWLAGDWSIRFTILYSNSAHWINNRQDWEWVKRNLTWHPKGGWTPAAQPAAGVTPGERKGE